jgi:hypothetical protein
MSETHRHWTDEEEKLLLELKRQEKPVAVIAKVLQRTEVAIGDRLALMKENGGSVLRPPHLAAPHCLNSMVSAARP